jgi:hypothetical protein
MSKQCVIFSLLIFSICYDEFMADDSPCGDWEPYKEEKCFKIFDKVGLQTYEDAKKTCNQQENGSSLITIHFSQEQDFISNIFKTHKVPNDVWIGLKYTNNKYEWSDGSDLAFTNWAQEGPKNKTDHCVQLNYGEDSFGKWSDVICDRKNIVVCQKMQTLSLSQLQNILFDIKKNIVPIGFIYVQLPSEKSPTEIWPLMKWNDVSSTYAGVFFRVTGGLAASFGQVQEYDAPQVTNFSAVLYGRGNSVLVANRTLYQLRKGMVSTTSGGCIHGDIQFTTSNAEVRPRNMAIRVWKRTG